MKSKEEKNDDFFYGCIKLSAENVMEHHYEGI